MTPQERQLINNLFDRVSTLETAPRDPAAERAIADAVARAPHAIYPLVQTVLVQDEALKRANSRIEEPETGSRNVDAPNENTSFLDSMRNALPGREQGSPGSLPSARQNLPPGEVPTAPAAMAPTVMAPGGSFLGNAAATAAGVIGGGLLSSGIRSLFSHRSGSERGDEARGDHTGEVGADDTDHRRDVDSDHSSTGLFDDDADDAEFDGDYDDDFDDGDEA
jgi:hypothetical protein